MEKIICAAIHYLDEPTPRQNNYTAPQTGLVLGGWRHANIIGQYYTLTGKPTREANSVQGFLTSLGRFVDRQEAQTIAIYAAQIPVGRVISGKQLYSEDIY